MSYSQNWHDPTWYSDSDVRNNPELLEMAIEYVEAYEGKFPPLVAAKDWLQEVRGKSMPASMLRKVVNTMRYDDDIKRKMPIPERFKEEPVTEKKKKKIPRCDDCKNGVPHYSMYVSHKEGSCPGVPWPINRSESVRMRLTVKSSHRYVKAKTGSMIHAVGGKASAQWHPKFHDWGFSSGSPDIHISTLCKYPSWIRNGTLLTVKEKRSMSQRKVDPVPFCEHCHAVLLETSES